MSPADPAFIPRPVPRVRFKNILLATDFGSASSPAQAYAMALSRLFGAHLFVLHVDEGPGLAKGGPVPARSDQIDSDVDFRKMGEVFSQAGVPFTFLVERGEVRETLRRAAEEHDIDLIVIGTHGRHGLSYLLLGSIAESFGRSSTRPVITVGPKARTGVESHIKHILYATDFSDEARLALPYATSLAQEFRSGLTIFHAAPPIERMVRDRTHIENVLMNQLINLAPPSRFPWCKVNHRITFGETTAEIIHQAGQENSDLIILGLHNSVRFTSHLPERLAYRILCEAPCPVLSVLPSTKELRTVQAGSEFLKKVSSFN